MKINLGLAPNAFQARLSDIQNFQPMQISTVGQSVPGD
jgi:hypothetical protein